MVLMLYAVAIGVGLLALLLRRRRMAPGEAGRANLRRWQSGEVEQEGAAESRSFFGWFGRRNG